jgi:hypothetical protein
MAPKPEQSTPEFHCERCGSDTHDTMVCVDQPVPFPPTRGDISRRLHGVISELTARAEAARAAGDRNDSSQGAAVMRGKARAYREAIVLPERLDKGMFIRGRRDYTEQRKRPGNGADS